MTIQDEIETRRKRHRLLCQKECDHIRLLAAVEVMAAAFAEIKTTDEVHEVWYHQIANDALAQAAALLWGEKR